MSRDVLDVGLVVPPERFGAAGLGFDLVTELEPPRAGWGA